MEPRAQVSHLISRIDPVTRRYRGYEFDPVPGLLISILLVPTSAAGPAAELGEADESNLVTFSNAITPELPRHTKPTIKRLEYYHCPDISVIRMCLSSLLPSAKYLTISSSHPHPKCTPTATALSCILVTKLNQSRLKHTGPPSTGKKPQRGSRR